MDEVPQQQPQEQKPNILEEFEFGIGGILLGVGTFLLLLFVLNYLNLVSLSLVFPKYFSWLPHRAQQGPTSQAKTFPPYSYWLYFLRDERNLWGKSANLSR